MSIPTEKELARMIQVRQDQIASEGFQMSERNPDVHKCQMSRHKKVKGRWRHEFCGEYADIEFEFAGPQNPAGVRVPLCKSCIARLINQLVRCLVFNENEAKPIVIEAG